MTCCFPNEDDGRRPNEHGGKQLRDRLFQSYGPHVSKDACESDEVEKNAPTGSRRPYDFGLPGSLPARLLKGERPGNPANGQFSERNPLEPAMHQYSSRMV